MDKTFYTEENPIRFPYAANYEGEGYTGYKGFVRLTLADGSVVRIEGSGEADNSMFSGISNIRKLEFGRKCTGQKSGRFGYPQGLIELDISKKTSLDAMPLPSDLDFIKVENGHPLYDSRDDCNALMDTAENKLCRTTNNTIVPKDCEIIGVGSFSFLSSLASVTIPASVTAIQEGSSFYGCKNLSSIVVENDNPCYDSRDNCNAIIDSSTDTLLYGCKTTTIPNGVKRIFDYAFSNGTDFTELTIPDSVVEIGACLANQRNLNSITYLGTIEQWNNITKDSNWNRNVPATVVHCSDGDVNI